MSFRPMSLHSSPMPYLVSPLQRLRAAEHSARQDSLDPVVGASSGVSRPHVSPQRLRMASTMSTPGWVPTRSLPLAQQRFVLAAEQVLGPFPTMPAYPMPMPSRLVVQGGGPGIAVATPNELIAGGSRDAGPSMATPDALRASVQNSDTSGNVALPDGTVIDPQSPQIDVPSDADLLNEVVIARDAAVREVRRMAQSSPPWLLILGVAGVAGGLLFLASR